MTKANAGLLTASVGFSFDRRMLRQFETLKRRLHVGSSTEAMRRMLDLLEKVTAPDVVLMMKEKDGTLTKIVLF